MFKVFTSLYRLIKLKAEDLQAALRLFYKLEKLQNGKGVDLRFGERE